MPHARCAHSLSYGECRDWTPLAPPAPVVGIDTGRPGGDHSAEVRGSVVDGKLRIDSAKVTPAPEAAPEAVVWLERATSGGGYLEADALMLLPVGLEVQIRTLRWRVYLQGRSAIAASGTAPTLAAAQDAALRAAGRKP